MNCRLHLIVFSSWVELLQASSDSFQQLGGACAMSVTDLEVCVLPEGQTVEVYTP